MWKWGIIGMIIKGILPVSRRWDNRLHIISMRTLCILAFAKSFSHSLLLVLLVANPILSGKTEWDLETSAVSKLLNLPWTWAKGQTDTKPDTKSDEGRNWHCGCMCVLKKKKKRKEIPLTYLERKKIGDCYYHLLLCNCCWVSLRCGLGWEW